VKLPPKRPGSKALTTHFIGGRESARRIRLDAGMMMS
jgi:hypothetical protein